MFSATTAGFIIAELRFFNGGVPCPTPAISFEGTQDGVRARGWTFHPHRIGRSKMDGRQRRDGTCRNPRCQSNPAGRATPLLLKNDSAAIKDALRRSSSRPAPELAGPRGRHRWRAMELEQTMT